MFIKFYLFYGDSKGIRNPVNWMKTSYPKPLDDGAVFDIISFLINSIISNYTHYHVKVNILMSVLPRGFEPLCSPGKGDILNH